MTWRTPAGVSPANRRTMSSLLRLVPASEIAPAEWDRLVEASPDGWVFALSGWQRLIVRVTAWDLREMSVGVYHEDALVAVMPLQYQAASRRLSSSGWGLTGPVVSASVEPALRAEVLARCLDHCKTVAGTLRATAIDIGRMAATRTAMADRDTDVLVSLGFADTSTDSMVIDLAPSEEELWARLSKNARQMVRKAEAAGYRVALCDWREYLDAYYSVHSETYTRTGVPPHPRAYFEGIANEMAPSGHAALWAGFGPNGDAVAFHNDARLGPGALYHTGCSRTAHLESGINYLLMWEAIRGAKREGRHWYEVGEVFPGAEGKSRGLTVFKSKFGGSPRRFIKGHLDLPAYADSGESTDAAMRAAYSSGALYATATICRTVSEGATEYVERLLEQKVAEVRRHYTAGVVVDLCCASGAHVLELAPAVQRAVGIDFSERYLIEGQSQARAGSLGNVAFVQGDARAVPMASGSVQLLYCFSALYAIPRAADVVAEAGRVLADGGYAVLDFGNRRSLNVFCLRYYTEWPAPHPLTLGEIAEALRRAGLEVVTHRRFQLLPLWADRPSWLWPLLHPAWKRVMKTDLGGRMLDEWVSSLPLLRRFAFRHLIVCRKALMGARG